MKQIVSILLMCFFCLIGTAAEAETSGYTQIDQETAKEMMLQDDGHVIVDVRRQDEYDAGHIPGAICVPNESIGCDSPEALPDYDQIILIYCRSGRRSKEAAKKLAGMGYTNIYEFGGILDWTGEIAAKDIPSEDAASLRFSSFAGGGYEYQVEIEDPSVVNCKTEYEYEAQADEIDGASFDFIVTFTGLKPGTTTITVYGRSPILENEDSMYTVNVDDTLNVSLIPVRTISTLYLYRNGEIYYDTYQISMDTDGYHVSISEEPEQPVSTDVIDALMKVIDTYEVMSWDGFSESKDYVLDGEGFWLDLTLTDGTRVHAVGDNAFPEHYFEAMGEMWNILTELEP